MPPTNSDGVPYFANASAAPLSPVKLALLWVEPARALDLITAANLVIFAAGFYKLPDLLGHNGDHIRGQVLVGSIAAGIAAYVSIRFLTRYFETRTLTPFAIYSLVFGIAMIFYTTLS